MGTGRAAPSPASAAAAAGAAGAPALSSAARWQMSFSICRVPGYLISQV